jgi:RNA polymerase sigma factor (sigma-70 family)
MEPRTTKVNLADLPDEALAARVQDGDEDAARVLFRRYWTTGRAIARAGGITEDWSDLYGDVWLACVSPGRFDPARGRFRSYLRKALVNEVRRAHQRRRRSPPLGTAANLDGSGEVDQRREPTRGDEATDEQRAALRAAVRELVAEWEAGGTRSRQHRQWAASARALYLEHRTFSEAAGDLGVSLKTIHNCLSRQIHPAIRDRIGHTGRHDALGAAQTEAGQHALPET